MFCLRSWLPLLFIPTNASPLFIISFVTLTYILHRPCIYCSALLLILFISSCHWSDRCFFDLRGDWFAPRYPTSTVTTAPTYLNSTSTVAGGSSSSLACGGGSFGEEGSKDLAGYVFDAVNSTAKALAGAAVEEVQRRFQNGSLSTSSVPPSSSVSSMISTTTTNAVVSEEEWTGIGLGWLRSLLGRREWTVPCVDVKVRL